MVSWLFGLDIKAKRGFGGRARMDNIIGLHKKSSTAKISRFVPVSYYCHSSGRFRNLERGVQPLDTIKVGY